MMGKQPRPQNSLFYVGLNIDNLVRKNHPLREVDEFIDFDFAYSKVKDCYGNNGNSPFTFYIFSNSVMIFSHFVLNFSSTSKISRVKI
jgi:hypothetical protein